MASNTAVPTCESELLDQDFRPPASKERVNLCESLKGTVLLVVPGFPSNDLLRQEPETVQSQCQSGPSGIWWLCSKVRSGDWRGHV